MPFEQYNRDWIAAIGSRRAHIDRTRAVAKTRQYRLELNAGDEPCLSVPLVIDQAEFDAVADAGRLLLRAQSKILRHLHATLPRTDLIRMFGVPEAMVPLIDWDHLVDHARHVVRFDAVPCDHGTYFCEINYDTTVAGFELFESTQVYAEATGWPLLDGTHAPYEDIRQMIERVAAQKGLKRVLVCDWSTYRHLPIFGFEFLYRKLKEGLPHLDVQMAYENAYPEHWLQAGAAQDTLVYRGFMYADMDDDGIFFRRLKDSGATIIHAFETEIRSNKRWFAMFHAPQYHNLLDRAEITAIERFVPWTCTFDEHSLSALLEKKDDYVFKLNNSFGGKGLLIGAEAPANELRGLILAKGASNWTAQQLIESEKLDLPDDDDGPTARHRVVLGLFLIDGVASGLVVRASQQSRIVNVSLGIAKCLWAVPMTPERRAKNLARILEPAAVQVPG